MPVNVKEKEDQQKNNLTNLLGNDKKEELVKILAFGEKYKKEGEKMKKNFWKNSKREQYISLITQYKESEEKFLGGLDSEEKEILENLKGVSREKFIEEYLFENILYLGNPDLKKSRADCIKFDYEDFVDGKVILKDGALILFELSKQELGDNGLKELIGILKLKEGVYLDLKENQIGKKGAEYLTKLKLKEGVTLDFGRNCIGYEGAEILAEKMKLKEGIYLRLGENEIGDIGVEAIAEKMELKEGVSLDLYGNEITDWGAESIMEKMEMKNGMILDLRYNKLSEETKNKLKEWKKNYQDQGINCEVIT